MFISSTQGRYEMSLIDNQLWNYKRILTTGFFTKLSYSALD